MQRSLRVRQRRTIGLRSIFSTAVHEYPKRSILCISLFVGQAFIYNGITFNLGTLMTKFFHVSTSIVPVFIILYAGANFLGPLLLGRLFDTVGRIPMIAGTYLGSSVLGLLLAGVFVETGVFTRWTFIVMVMVTFFFASAGASAAYLTSSEIFPMETRALAIAMFYAVGTAVGGISGPLLFGPLITTGRRDLVGLAFFIGSVRMAAGAAAELAFGVKAERQQLEDIAAPLTADDAETARTAQQERGAGSESEKEPAGGAGGSGAARRAAEHRARAAEHRARAAEHRAGLHEALAGGAGAGAIDLELEETLALLADARALAEDERAAAEDARDTLTPAGNGSGAGGERVRAAELRAHSHEEEAQALLSDGDGEAESHRRLAAAALERARAAEQRATAAEARGASGATASSRARLEVEMHDAWAQMHDLRARALELRAERRDELANEHERRADQAAERARAATFRIEAEDHRTHARAQHEEAEARSGGGRLSPEESRQESEDDRARQRIARRLEREGAGIRRYMPGTGRLGRAPGGTGVPPLEEEALDHEILAIERALFKHGPTDRRELARMVGAPYWGPGVYVEALRQAVADGTVHRISRRVYAYSATADGRPSGSPRAAS